MIPTSRLVRFRAAKRLMIFRIATNTIWYTRNDSRCIRCAVERPKRKSLESLRFSGGGTRRQAVLGGNVKEGHDK